MDQRRSTWGLTETEREDLIWFFDGAKGGFGVRSNFGAMQDELNRRSLSDETKRNLKADEARQREAMLRRRRRKPTIPGALAAMLGAVGISSPIDLGPEEIELPPTWAREHSKPKRAPVFPSEPAIDLEKVEQASHTRLRLAEIGSGWASVLLAAYGPRAGEWRRDARGSTDHPAILIGKAANYGRVDYVDGTCLVEIAIAVLESQREEGDPSGRSLLWTKMVNPQAAVPIALEARKLYDGASQAFCGTRCEWAPNPRYRCERCWSE